MAGEHETPLAHFDRAEQCNPEEAHLDNVDGGRAFCHWLAGRYDDASFYAERAVQQLPGHVGGHVVAMAAAMAAGRAEQAREAARRFLKVFPLGAAAPAIQSIPIRSPQHKDMLVAAVAEACAMAGLPALLGQCFACSIRHEPQAGRGHASGSGAAVCRSQHGAASRPCAGRIL
jgi:tetratricopeptide (TPR) repeat protein